MNWAYLAGFFDGEGSVNMTTRVPTLSIAQALRDDNVLAEIRRFLLSKKVHCKIANKKRGKPHYLPPQCIIICRHSDVAYVLLRMMPYLIVKRQRADIALTHIRSRIWRRYRVSIAMLQQARKAYLSGMSMRASARKFKMDPHALARYTDSLKDRRRGRSEAITLWHSRLSRAQKAKLRRSLSRGWRERQKRLSPRASR